MARVPKNCVLALLVGAALFAVGTVLARDCMRPLSQRDAEMLSGGTACANGKCYSSCVCDSVSCGEFSIADCNDSSMKSKSWNSVDCDGNTDWWCRKSNYGSCGYEAACSWSPLSNDCVRVGDSEDISDYRSCSSGLN